MELFTYWRSSAAFRVRIVLNLKGVDYQSRSVDLRIGEQGSDAYLATNPQGLVPTLVDGDTSLTQSLAILEYLEETHPQPSLLPAPVAERAAVRAFCLAVACDMHPLCNLRVLKHLKSDLGQDQDGVNAWYKHWMQVGFAGLEPMAMQSDGQYCCGDSVTLADVCLVPQIYNAERFDCDLSEFPALRRINETLLSIDAFAAALPENQPDANN